ncbi:hypothetical protein [Streptomyces sp. Isolate_45]|uniref:hypothetical protein n=1 Tax=Streptomyces sp. Isolate_45 TaxID=2950111 RepID=UPI002481AA9E|nr:hypothetical protein [Streptomyces sp. Isolate_45]MDA5283296.1 hypothetical protein [Streptomyces sp. Isolate_45]
MQLRRAALPLSLLALLASAGCVSVGPESGAAGPVRGSTPPLGRQDAPEGRRSDDGPPELALPLSALPDPEPDPPRPGAGSDDRQRQGVRDDVRVHAPDPRTRKADPPARRHAKPTAPRRVRPAQPTPPRVPRPAAPRLPRGEELCAAAEGTVPPSVVDLCVRQYGH